MQLKANGYNFLKSTSMPCASISCKMLLMKQANEMESEGDEGFRFTMSSIIL